MGRLQLLGALLEAPLECLEDLECQEVLEVECQEDLECQEANTTRDVFASTCPATLGLEAPGCPRCHQQDLDQDLQRAQDQDIQALDLEALDLDLVPHLFLPLVAMEQVGNSAESSSSFSVLECKFYPPFLFLPYTKRGQVRKVKSCWTNI